MQQFYILNLGLVKKKGRIIEDFFCSNIEDKFDLGKTV